MTAFFQLMKMAFISVVTIVISPFFWLVLFLIYLQYKKMNNMEVRMFGRSKKKIKERLKHTTLIGLIGGIIATAFIMVLGITIDIKDFAYIFPLAILLLWINARYICFSYAGGILALSNLIFGFPKINVSSVMAIIAILHLVESILIWFDGHKDATPIFLEDKTYGVVGGFLLQRFWILPFAVLIMVIGPLEGAKELELPDWWPLFKAGVNLENFALQISTVVAALGYGDMASTYSPKEKCKKSATRLMIFSGLLLIFSLLSTSINSFKFIAAAFAPIGHELLVLYGQREEKKRIPIFRNHGQGVTVLDLWDESIGQQLQLKPGDVILSINNSSVNNKEDIQNILSQYPSYIWLEVMDQKGRKKTIEYQDYRKSINELGIIVIPKDAPVIFSLEASRSPLKHVWKKLFSKKTFHK